MPPRHEVWRVADQTTSLRYDNWIPSIQRQAGQLPLGLNGVQEMSDQQQVGKIEKQKYHAVDQEIGDGIIITKLAEDDFHEHPRQLVIANIAGIASAGISVERIVWKPIWCQLIWIAAIDSRHSTGYDVVIDIPVEIWQGKYCFRYARGARLG